MNKNYYNKNLNQKTFKNMNLKGISFLKGVGSHFKIPRFRSAPYKRGRYVAALLVALLVRYSCVTRCVTRHLHCAEYCRHTRGAPLPI